MSQPTPSIDKNHGFMKSIIRNQIDRDKYDQEVKAAKERERQEKRRQSSKNRRPEQAHYVPPVRGLEAQATAILFRLEYEDEWGKLHQVDIKRNDDPYQVAENFGREHDMDEAMIMALARKLAREISIRVDASPR